MEKQNILMVYSAKGFGGMPRNLSLILANLNPRKFRVSVVLLGDSDDQEADLRNMLENSPEVLRNFYCLGTGKKFDLDVLKELSKVIDEEQIRILSCHGYKADIFGVLLKHIYQKNIRLFTIAHGWVSSTIKLRLYDLLDKVSMRFFDRVILVSDKQWRQLGSVFLDRTKVEVINNAVDIESFQCKSRSGALISELGLEPEALVVGFAGRLSPEKGIGDALKIIEKVVLEKNNLKFVIVGDGPQRAELEQAVEKLGLSQNVKFVGFRKEMKAFYSIFNVYLSCSLREGLPNTVLEAMAAGVPCVLSNIAGHNDVVEDGTSGFLIEREDIELGAERIHLLLDDSSCAGSIRDEARKVLQKSFSIAKRVAKLEEAYLKLLN